MTKNELKQVTDAAVEATKNALQIVYDTLNQGQQKKLLKEQAVKDLFDLYGVEYSE